MAKKLNIIDFDYGVRSEEIQENFEILQDEINRERISIGGPGIANGLDITVTANENDFYITVSSGTIITKDGEEIFIEEQTIDIERPMLSQQCEYLVADTKNQITLNEVPYSFFSRYEPVEFSDSYLPTASGIDINYVNSIATDDGIRVKAIKDKTLTLTGLVKRSLKIKYYSTADRIDTLYIDNNNQLQVKVSSITSTTPSAILPDNYKYLIAYLLITSDYKENSEDTPHANILIKKDLRDKRNLYTDSNGVLYICGIPFDDLEFINMEEPEDLHENQLWLNLNNNTLYVYKKVDNYFYKKTIEVTTDFQDGQDEVDYKTNIAYKVEQGELSVYVNGVRLTKDIDYVEMFGGIPSTNQTILKDSESDTFRVYKSLYIGDKITYCINIKESGMMWVPVNKESYVNTKEIKYYGIHDTWPGGNYWQTKLAKDLGENENYPYKYQFFFFDAEQDRRMLFTPNRHEVDVYVNQFPLHSDQYIELTLDNVFDYAPQCVIDSLFKDENYHWANYKTTALNKDEDTGLGIMLIEPLDARYSEGLEDELRYDELGTPLIEEDLFVEIRVNRSVVDTPSKRKLQRIATYINEDDIVVEDPNIKNVDIKTGYYRYGEKQLEVYLNGVRLTENVDYIEGTDIGTPDTDLLNKNLEYLDSYDTSVAMRDKGTPSRRFTIRRLLNTGDNITYRITSTYYSYDHINSLLDSIDVDYEEFKTAIDSFGTKLDELEASFGSSIMNMQTTINQIAGNLSQDQDTYLTVNSVIKESQLNAEFSARVPQTLNFINASIKSDGTTKSYRVGSLNNDTYNIREKDYVQLIHRMKEGTEFLKDKFLIRDENYTLEDVVVNNSYSVTQLTISDNYIGNISDGDELIITGIRFGREGR